MEQLKAQQAQPQPPEKIIGKNLRGKSIHDVESPPSITVPIKVEFQKKTLAKEALRETFEHLGAKKWQLAFQKGRPLGFAVVEFESNESAKAALFGLENCEFLLISSERGFRNSSVLYNAGEIGV